MIREKFDIRRRLTTVGVAVAAGGMVLAATTADAKIVNSTNGVGAIIKPPASVCDDAPGAENTFQEGFDEAQGVFLGAGGVLVDIAPGTGSLPGVAVGANTPVDSHMIFLNTAVRGRTQDFSVTWTFDGPVLGVMSDKNGTLEALTSALLGNPATDYLLNGAGGACTGSGAAAFGTRGLERSTIGVAADGYTFAANTLTVGMAVREPGDWIRVITAGVLDVDIDIKPGSDPNCFNIDGHGALPVAIFGSAELDVMYIDLSSLSFGDLPVRVRGNKEPLCSFDFVDVDGFLDLVCQFEDDDSFRAPGDGTATVSGTTTTDPSFAFEGTDAICIVPPT